MGVTFCKVFWNDKSTGSPNNVKEITDLVSWTDKHAINVKSNMAELIVSNINSLSRPSSYFDGGGNLRFSIGGTSTSGGTEETDDIEIYLSTAPVTYGTDADILCSMSITGIEERFDENQKSFRLSCTDKTYLLLSHYVVGNYPQGGGSAPAYQMVQEIIRQWANLTSNTADVIDVTTNVATAQSDGGVMPDKQYSSVYKPIYETLSELSQQEYTGDIRPFIFWVDKQNKLHWIYPTQTGGTELNELSNDITSIKIGKSEANEVNMIVYSAGKDKNGVNILDYGLNTESGSTLKMAYFDWSDITSNMKLPNVIATQWDDYDNDEVRTKSKAIGQARCWSKFAGKGLKWSGTISMRGNKDFNAGDLILFTSANLGFTNFKLRIMDILQTVTNGIWKTDLEVEEDPMELV